MSHRNDSKVQRQVYVQAERRVRQERRSLSESLSDGTSKFFSSIVAKKNGFLNDISSKIESTLSLGQDGSNKSTGVHECAAAPTSTSRGTNNRPTSTSRLNKAPSREGRMVKRMPSLPTNGRMNSKPEAERNVQLRNQRSVTSASSQERFTVNGMSISFDEPILSRPEMSESFPVTNISVSDTRSCETRLPRTRHTFTQQARTELNSHKNDTSNKNSSQTSRTGNYNRIGNGVSKTSGSTTDRGNGQPGSAWEGSENQVNKTKETNIYADQTTRNLENNNKLFSGSNHFDEIVKMHSNKEITYADSCKTLSDTVLDGTSNKHEIISTRSNTVDEMLFDDFIKPEVDAIVLKESSNENLISFAQEHQEINSSKTEDKADGVAVSHVDPCNEGVVNVAVHRTASFGSEKSWSSVYSVDSQPDDMAVESMDFMKVFVDKVFNSSESISQIEKAKFGELCQHFQGRLWFSRYVSSQRVHHKKVSENVFYSLMQYFAVCLFECYEADDFSPAKTLMNMCFTFNHEAQTEKIFLYMCMREQPIWRSLRFWNAAYFDAVQCERSRRPMPTNSDESETMSDDRQFQENITFGQLGTFACNMREFGLSKELCLEFLRKQSIIANLGKEQVNLLRENIERIKDT